MFESAVKQHTHGDIMLSSNKAAKEAYLHRAEVHPNCSE